MPSGGSARPSDKGWSRPPRCGCRSDADRLAKVARAEMKITHRLGRTPTERELAEETGHEPAKLLTSLIDVRSCGGWASSSSRSDPSLT
ncbi:sigma-70 domain-containing protein [Nonomuraea sp. NPDC049028]|uniref:sigma-70 domain-containing protein n=1 Tax=Nonomuraea sp. NPDC049028 TaxID=3364348 RepID=UPI00371604A8